MWAMLLPVSGELYAIPAGWAREVVIAPRPTPLVTAPTVVLGLFNLRGEIIPLLDTVGLLGVGRIESPDYAVVLRCPQGPAALATTGLPQHVELGFRVGTSELDATDGCYRVDQNAAVLLAPGRLLGLGRGR
jgi:purine-binding chemotaxis protein CheW